MRGVIAVLLALQVAWSIAAELQWDADTDNDWGKATNWENDTFPGSTKVARVDTTPHAQIGNNDATNMDVVISGTGDVRVQGTGNTFSSLMVSGGSLDVTNTGGLTVTVAQVTDGVVKLTGGGGGASLAVDDLTLSGGSDRLQVQNGVASIGQFARSGTNNVEISGGSELSITTSISDSGAGDIDMSGGSTLTLDGIMGNTLRNVDMSGSGNSVSASGSTLTIENVSLGNLGNEVSAQSGSHITLSGDIVRPGTLTTSADSQIEVTGSNSGGGNFRIEGVVTWKNDHTGSNIWKIRNGGDLRVASDVSLSTSEADNILTSGEFGPRSSGELEFTAGTFHINENGIVNRGGLLQFNNLNVTHDLIHHSGNTTADDVSVTRAGSIEGFVNVKGGTLTTKDVNVHYGVMAADGGDIVMDKLYVSRDSGSGVRVRGDGSILVQDSFSVEDFPKSSGNHVDVHQGTITFEKDVDFKSNRLRFTLSGINGHPGTAVFNGKMDYENPSPSFYPSGLFNLGQFAQVVLNGISVIEQDALFDSGGLTAGDGAKVDLDDQYWRNTIDFQSGSLQVNGEVEVKSTMTVNLGEGSTLNFGPNGKITFKDYSSLTYAKGAVLFQDLGNDKIVWESRGTFEGPPGDTIIVDTNITFASGTVIIRDNGTLDVRGGGLLRASGTFALIMLGLPRSDFGIIRDGGRIQYSGGANLTLVNTTFRVDSGTFDMFGQSLLWMNISDLYVGDALSVWGNASIDASASTITVNASMNTNGSSTTELDMVTLRVLEDLVIDGDSYFSTAGMSMVSIENGGSLTTNGQSTTLMTDGSSIDIEGNIYSGGSSETTFSTGSLATINGGVLTVRDSSEFTVTSSSCVIVPDGFVYVDGTSTMNVDNGACLNVTEAGMGFGTINVQGMGTLSSSGGFVYLTGGYLYVASTSTMKQNSGAQLVIEDGFWYNSGKLNSTDSVISVLQGFASLQTSSVQLLESATITISNGSLYFAGQMSANSSQLNVVAGDARFRSGAFGTFQGTVNIVGDLLFEGSANMEFPSSHIDVTGAVTVDDTATVNITDTSTATIGGSFTVTQDATLFVDLSTITVDGGSVTIDEDATLDLGSTSEIIVSAGSFEILDRVSIASDSATIDVDGRFLIDGAAISHVFATADIDVGGQFIVASGASIGFDSISDVVVDGDMMIIDDSHLFMDFSTLTVDGNLIANDSVSLDFTRVDITIGGSFFMLHQANFTADQMDMSVSGTVMWQGDSSSVYTMDRSEIRVSGGVMSVSGYATSPSPYASRSKLWAVNGDLIFEDDVHLTLENSILETTSGTILFRDFAQLTMNQLLGSTGIFMSAGSLEARDNANIDLNAVDVEAAGDISIFDDAVFRLDNGEIQLSGGGLFFHDNSDVIISNSDTTLDSGGDLVVNSTVLVTLQNQRISVLNGDVRVVEFASVLFSVVDVIVSGGNILLETSTRTNLTSSPLSLTNGNFDAQGYSVVNIQSSPVDVTDGLLHFSDNCVVTAINSPFALSGGYFNVSDNAIFNVADVSTTFDISGGVMSFMDNASFNIPVGIQFTGEAGAVHFRDNVNIAFSSATFTVSGTMADAAEIKLLDSASLSFLASTVIMTDGSFEVLGNSGILLQDGTLTISDGQFLISIDRGTNVTIQDNPVDITGGSLDIEWNSAVHINGPSLTISDGELNMIDNTTLWATASSIDILGGVLRASGVAQMFMEETPIRIEADILGGLAFRDDAKLHLVSATSDVNVVSGKIEFHDSTEITTVPGVKLAIEGGQLSMTDAASLSGDQVSIDVLADVFSSGSMYVNSAASLTLTNSWITVEGIFEVSNSAVLDLTSVEMNVFGSFFTGANFLGQNLTLAVDGQFTMDESHVFSLNRSSIQISNGVTSIGAYAFSTIEMIDTPVTISNGNVIIRSRAQPNLLRSTFDVDGGSVTCQNFAHISFNSSALTVNSAGGGFLAQTRCVLEMTASPAAFFEGDFTLSDNSRYQTNDALSPVSVDGGSVSVQGQATWDLFPGTVVSVRSGNVDFKDYVTCNWDTITLDVDGSGARAGTAEVTLSNDANITMTGSTVNVNTGSMAVKDDAFMCFISTIVTLTDASFDLLDNAKLCLDGSTLDVFGSFTADGAFSLTVDNSDITIQDGSISLIGEMEDLGEVTLTDSTIELAAGSTSSQFLLEHVHAIFEDSLVNSVGGSFRGAGGTEVETRNTNIILTGDGEILFEDDSQLNVGANTTLSMDTATANLHFRDDSTLALLPDGVVHVTGGSAVFDDDSSFIISGDGNFTLLSGNFVAQGRSTILALPNSKGLVNGGSLSVIHEAQMTMISSLITIIGSIHYNSTEPLRLIGDSAIVVNGDPVIINGGVFSVNDSSSVIVSEGSLQFYNDAVFNARSGFVLVTDGFIELFNETLMRVSAGSEVVVAQGAIVVHDDAQYTSIASNTTVSFVEDGGGVIPGLFKADGRGTISIEDGSTLSVSGGDVLLEDWGKLKVLSASEVDVDGSVVLVDDSQLTVDASIFSVITDGFINVNDRATVDVSNSVLSISEGGVGVTDDAVFGTTASSTVTIDLGGGVAVSGSGHAQFLDSTLDITGGGGFDLSENGTLLVGDGSVATITDGAINSTDSGCITVEAEALLQVDGGNIFIADSGCIVSTTEGTVQVIDGVVELRNEATATISIGGHIAVEEATGSFHLLDNAELHMSSGGELRIEDGSLQLHSKVVSYESHVIVNDGTATFFAGTEALLYLTGLDFNGGLTSFLQDSLVLLDGSHMVVNDGTVSITDATLTMVNSAVFQSTGGTTTFSDGSISMTDSQFIARNGVVEVAGSTEWTSQDSEIQLVSNTAKRGTASCSADLITARGSAQIQLYSGTHFNAIAGGFRVEEDARVESVEALFTFSGGCLTLAGSGSSESTFTDSSINMEGGSFTAQGSGSVSFAGVVYTGDDGVLQFQGNAEFTSDDSTYAVSGSGEIRFGGSKSTITNSFIKLSGGGDIVVSATDSEWDNIAVDLSNGALRASGSGQWDVSNSDIDIDGGDYEFVGSSNTDFKDSTVTLQSGSVRSSGDAVVQFGSGTVFEVIDGSVVFGGRSDVSMDSEAEIRVSGGNFHVTDDARFVQDFACVYVTETSMGTGNLIFSESTVVHLEKGCFWVLGGDALFEDHSEVVFDSESFLDVRLGSFIARHNADVVADDGSSIRVTGGDFRIEDSANVVVTKNSEVDVQLGNAIWSGQGRTTVDDGAVFGVHGGDARFEGECVVSFEGGLLDISLGSLLALDSSLFTVDDAHVRIRGGLFAVRDSSSIEITEDSTVKLTLGSVHIEDTSTWSMIRGELEIDGGNLVFSDSSLALFERTDVVISSGSLAALGNSVVITSTTAVSVMGGDVQVQDSARVTVIECDWQIGGDVTVINHGILEFDRSDLTVSGNLRLQDQAQLKTERDTRVVVEDGNVVIQNLASDDRQQVSFSDTVLEVTRSSAGNEARGHFSVAGWVDVNMKDSFVSIDGDLSIFGYALLNLTNTMFEVPTGSVKLDRFGAIRMHEGSKLKNQGYVFPPGVIEYGLGEGLENNGLFETNSELAVNCEGGNSATPFLNSGTLRFMQDESEVEQLAACIDSLESDGVMELNGRDVTFRELHQSENGVTRLTDAFLDMGGAVFESAGSISGTGRLGGQLLNQGAVLAEGLEGATRLTVDGLFTSSEGSWVFFIVNSLDENDELSVTQVSADVIDLSGTPKACICLGPDLDPDSDTEVVIARAEAEMIGEFEVQFQCAACGERRARSVAGVNACDGDTSYSGRNMAVVFSGCGGRDGLGSGILSVEPPIYIVLPVGFGVLVFVVIVFGAVMTIAERRRKQKNIKKIDRRRHAALCDMTASDTSRSGASDV